MGQYYGTVGRSRWTGPIGNDERSFLGLGLKLETYGLLRNEDLQQFSEQIGNFVTGLSSCLFIDPQPPARRGFYVVPELDS